MIVAHCINCIRKSQVWELSRLCPETSTKLYFHEFGFCCMAQSSDNCNGSLPFETACYEKWWTIPLKGQCHEIFCFLFFSWISFPPAPEYHIRTVLNFFENSRRYSQAKVHHRYQQHRCCWYRWQIFPPFFLVLLIPVANLPPVLLTPVGICCRYQRHRRQICPRCQWRWWQIMGTISGCWDLKVNLKAKMYL